ncbi:MAG: hypothetical protein M1828_001064 [Chrysothrix sp. TS-e1954]|nr:MAG: hypothetical protein M1828_001064 [Chrysothrix sp. TS-e1954]
MASEARPVFYFDIDNCLYSRSKKVQNMMGELIDRYFMTHLSLSQEDAFELHQRYYKDYGLAIEGLVRHHKVDPLEYNSQVDDALPLEDVLGPDEKLRELLLDLDTTKVRPWLFTNAYVTHGKRVVKLLGIDDLFEGITYCDYGAQSFVCKPHAEMFDKAQRDAGATSAEQCYFVDDSALNCQAAQNLGWNAVHFSEPDQPRAQQQAANYRIKSLQELRTIFPDFFRNAHTKS